MVRIKYRYFVCFASIQSVGPASRNSPAGYPGCNLADKVAMQLGDSELVNLIRRSVLDAHGTIGMGKCMSRLRIIHWCPASGLLVLRCLRDVCALMQVALALIMRIDMFGQKRNCLIDIHHSSGTVRGCQKFLVNFYSRQLYSRPKPEFSTALSIAVNKKGVSVNVPQILTEN